ncbi:MAG: Pr6Pr family membrane protein [Actinobacteria bacterium]|nr:Pr6Pr family membrane protein [Actinomycetota bacterium]
MSSDPTRVYTTPGATVRQGLAPTVVLPDGYSAGSASGTPRGETRVMPSGPAHLSAPAQLPPPRLAAPDPSMRTDRYPVARWVFGTVGAIALLAILAQLIVVVAGSADLSMAINFLGLFGMTAALVAGISSLMLAANPIRVSGAFSAFRMAGLLMAVGTLAMMAMGVPAFYTPSAAQVLVDALLNVVVPTLVLGSWLFLGPRPRLSVKQIGGAVTIPAVWLVYTMLHGAITGFYAYSYLNLAAVGAAALAVNIFFLFFLAVAICVALVYLDKLLPWAPRA